MTRPKPLQLAIRRRSKFSVSSGDSEKPFSSSVQLNVFLPSGSLAAGCQSIQRGTPQVRLPL